MAQTVRNLPVIQESRVQSLGGEDPLEKEMATTPVFLRGESHGHRSLEGYSPWGHKESYNQCSVEILSRICCSTKSVSKSYTYFIVDI